MLNQGFRMRGIRHQCSQCQDITSSEKPHLPCHGSFDGALLQAQLLQHEFSLLTALRVSFKLAPCICCVNKCAATLVATCMHTCENMRAHTCENMHARAHV